MRAMLAGKAGTRVMLRSGRTHLCQGTDVKGFLELIRKVQQGSDLEANEDCTEVRVRCEGREFVFSGPQAAYLWTELLYDGAYSRLNVRGATVIDVGANIGDSAVYLLLRGAGRVVCIEPSQGNSRLAQENLRRAGLESGCTWITGAVGAEDATARFSEAESDGTVTHQMGEGEHSVRVMGFAQLLRDHADSSTVVKMDCEGAEYDAILSTPPAVLRCAREYLIEYHYGYQNLKQHLEASGFQVSLLGRPKHFHIRGWKDPAVCVGFLHAVRRD